VSTNAVDPKNGNYYNNRGNTYFDMGEFQLAVDDFTTALGLEPYSPKTRLTLAQAHEALAQEKRMKNSVNYQGIFSSLKSKKDGKKLKSVRKDRVATIYVSPAGVEITFVHGGYVLGAPVDATCGCAHTAPALLQPLQEEGSAILPVERGHEDRAD